MEWAFQAALYARLTGDAGLFALGVTVVDDVPQGEDADPAAGYPMVTIGEMDVRDDGTKTSELWDVYLRVHTFSTSGSREQARAIQARLKELLHRASFPIEGYRLVMIRRERSSLARDPDRKRHGVCEYRALIEPI